jgi:hypothetical protein
MPQSFVPLSTPWRITNFTELSPSWEASSCGATQEFLDIYGTWMFITVFTIAQHWSLSSARSIQSILSRLFKIPFNIIYPPKSWSFWWSLSFYFPHQNTVWIPLRPIGATFSAQLILPDMLILIVLGEKYVMTHNDIVTCRPRQYSCHW